MRCTFGEMMTLTIRWEGWKICSTKVLEVDMLDFSSKKGFTFLKLIEKSERFT